MKPTDTLLAIFLALLVVLGIYAFGIGLIFLSSLVPMK